MSDNFGCLRPYVRLRHFFDPSFKTSIIQQVSSIKGFLINEQIPLMFAFATVARGNMAEIGCWYGRTTALLLAASEQSLQLHCVDTFKGSEEHQEELKGKTYKEDFERNIAPYRGNRCYVIPGFSHEAANLYPDKFFDYVWIDAAHDYDNVKRDVDSWYPKLKTGGLLIGHDYPEPNTNGGFEELVKAVHETVRDSGRFSEFGWFCGIWGARKL